MVADWLLFFFEWVAWANDRVFPLAFIQASALLQMTLNRAWDNALFALGHCLYNDCPVEHFELLALKHRKEVLVLDFLLAWCA